MPNAEHGAYEYDAVYTLFPDAMVAAADGETRHATFALRSADAPPHASRSVSGSSGTDGLVRMARCVIPDADGAAALVQEALQTFRASSWASSTAATNGKASGGGTCAEYVEVWFCRVKIDDVTYGDCVFDGYECVRYEVEEDDPWGGSGGGGAGDEPDPCESGADGMPTGQLCTAGSGPVEPSEAPEPCEIDDPRFAFMNSEGFAIGAQLMWSASRADDPRYERRKETIGHGSYNRAGVWQLQAITSDDAYSYRRWDTASGPGRPASELADGAVFVHTHPFQPGENFRDSDTRAPVRYETGASKADREALERLGYEFGVYLDKTYIVVFNSDDEDNGVVQKFDRCGY